MIGRRLHTFVPGSGRTVSDSTIVSSGVDDNVDFALCATAVGKGLADESTAEATLQRFQADLGVALGAGDLEIVRDTLRSMRLYHAVSGLESSECKMGAVACAFESHPCMFMIMMFMVGEAQDGVLRGRQRSCASPALAAHVNEWNKYRAFLRSQNVVEFMNCCAKDHPGWEPFVQRGLFAGADGGNLSVDPSVGNGAVPGQMSIPATHRCEWRSVVDEHTERPVVYEDSYSCLQFGLALETSCAGNINVAIERDHTVLRMVYSAYRDRVRAECERGSEAPFAQLTAVIPLDVLAFAEIDRTFVPVVFVNFKALHEVLDPVVGRMIRRSDVYMFLGEPSAIACAEDMMHTSVHLSKLSEPEGAGARSVWTTHGGWKVIIPVHMFRRR